ncbi:hypothetical protein TeGR_g5204, partial [Tetraparma gracilis]
SAPPTIGFLGNSLIYYNDLPSLLSPLLPHSAHLCLRGGCSLTTLLSKGARHPLTGHALHETVAGLFNGRRFDFVVMNDHSQAPARDETREESLASLRSTYAPQLASSGATPVLMATWSYRVPAKNSEDLGDVPEFTAKLAAGVAEYAALLASLLPSSQAPVVANWGAAALLVHRERRELWERLYDEDNYHPALLGSQLLARVIYVAVFGAEKGRERRDQEVGGGGDDEPTLSYFWTVAERVAGNQ